MPDNHADEPEEIAIAALSYIAADSVLLPRFLSLTGITISEIRSAAAEPGFLGGVLAFVLAHEPTLMDFSAQSGIAPERVVKAARHLPGGRDEWDRQP
ncbi:DUF3572 domain-containing protein [Notoacmeibacter sp. MSK16QG-6]|uniref:DUF3572 domain-containing protein n=1 Tax=Notoacmeibacter sp. MSK16QG-6 TaxID=2957982 RepID=UPI00209DD2E0|nr:DUF3572 domain-containing protein [Notoacmeibacter sp. MSK16QG-6]MCP1197896.1 DUF3572 domain-containing protein [Notoacmeibacter sp. MSK16QG-6]